MTVQTTGDRTDPVEGRVLVVEDNEINRTVIVRMLKKLGYECDVAHDGREGLETWRAHGHNLIMMDCEMPVMSGYEAATAIRAEQGEEGGPLIVATTAYVSNEHRDRCVAAGMDVFVAKPVTLAKLREALTRCEALAAERAAGGGKETDSSFGLVAS
ncbi:MAG: response regulator [Myxococcales bacterium FL481]|nr:MAG: response regulator [Myxococcales bacterium FL481]